MAETDNKQQIPAASAAAPQNPGAQARPCPKDCGKCTMAHQIYCTAKMTFDSFSVMSVIIQRIDLQSQRIAELEQRIQALQPAESEFSSPLPMESDLFDGK